MREVPDSNIHEAGSCGDFCGKCPNYRYDCQGCVPRKHPECHFVRCCQEKTIEHCGSCVDFPCEKLSTFVPEDRPGYPPGYHIMNLRARLTMGTAAWLAQQRKMWAGASGK